jgi:hypothetical protein
MWCAIIDFLVTVSASDCNGNAGGAGISNHETRKWSRMSKPTNEKRFPRAQLNLMLKILILIRQLE